MNQRESFYDMKKPKTPPVSRQTKLLSFDLETNGLHGQAFAVGAILIDGYGNINDEFSARTEIKEPIDDWVKKNVLPAIATMPITHKDYVAMREAFWTWYLQVEPESDYVLVNNGYPVEYRFLLDCQEANLDERYWQHPFPILELSSLQLQVANRPSKNKPTKDSLESKAYLPHHPLGDAKAAAVAAFQAFERAGLLD